MTDELNKSAEFTGRHQDEENPILVAQRYLNIFRQIHIFNKKRQAEFDDSLLQMPSDIRILLGTLPGGSLLLEHLAEVEEKKGIIPDELLNSKINEKKNSAEHDQSYALPKANPKSAENVAVSNNLIKILQQNEEKHAQDLQALTNAFLQSQQNMTALLRQALHIKAPQQHKAAPVQQKVAPVQQKAAPAQPYSFQEKKEPVRVQQQMIQTPKPEENNDVLPDAASKILNFTKKLFTQNKDEQELPETPQNVAIKTQTPQVSAPAIDQTPVSLDDIEGAPVALETPDSLGFSSVDTEEQSQNNNWEWEYVDDQNTPTDDEEWEYIDDENGAEQDGEWAYVEDPNAAYTYEYPETNDNTQWEYVEDPSVPPSSQS